MTIPLFSYIDMVLACSISCLLNIDNGGMAAPLA